MNTALHSEDDDIYEKILDSDWLRVVQFQGNSVRKKGSTLNMSSNFALNYHCLTPYYFFDVY